MSLNQLPTLEVHLEGEMFVFAFHLIPKAAYRANAGDRRNLCFLIQSKVLIQASSLPGFSSSLQCHDAKPPRH